MSKCHYCGKEPLETDSCIRVPIFHNGKEYDPIPYGVSSQDIDGGDRCRDCGVIVGGYHHPGCDREICPVCGGYVLSCDCNDNISPEEYKARQRLLKIVKKSKNKYSNVEFKNVERQDNKFVCQIGYKEIADFASQGIIGVNIETYNELSEPKNKKNIMGDFSSKFMMLNFLDKYKVNKIKNKILEENEGDIHLIRIIISYI